MRIGHSSRNDFAQLVPDLDDVNKGFKRMSYEELRRIADGHLRFTARNRMVRWLEQRFAPSARPHSKSAVAPDYVLLELDGL
jgi:hypothetical protein